jgi:hypothetical protein
MQPLLSTNYLSFYSSYYQSIQLKKAVQNMSEDLIFLRGGQVVADNIYNQLQWIGASTMEQISVVVIYCISITVLLVMVWRLMMQYKEERESV